VEKGYQLDLREKVKIPVFFFVLKELVNIFQFKPQKWLIRQIQGQSIENSYP
jgi:cytochrome c oxidase assembly protein Cox11